MEEEVYEVTWSTDVLATSQEEAVRKAWAEFRSASELDVILGTERQRFDMSDPDHPALTLTEIVDVFPEGWE